MAAIDGPAHLLSLKVMRISRPELSGAWQPFYSSSPSFSAHSSASILSLQGNTPLPGHPKTLRDLTNASEVLTLPSSFGSIQLGETFSSCLCVNNETQVEIEITQVKVEMQTVTTKMVLHESEGLGQTLAGTDTLEHVVHHEIKELGQHVLACTVTYRLPPNSRSVPGAAEDASDPSLQTFRKFYKFAVTNPLSVKTKVHSAKSPTALLSPTEREKIFLEVHIQNLTQDAISFERMRLECTDSWEAIDGNIIYGEDAKDGTSLFAGPMALMQPQDMRQYVYILTPKVTELSPASPAPGSIIPLGRLDISWRSSFGEPGRLLTSMLSRRIPLAPMPQPQPASALPSYLKRAGPTPSRPHSPSISSINQARPGTPPAGQRPGSPALRRDSVASIRPQSPQPTPIPPPNPLPEIDAQLVVRRVPREDVQIEKPFSIAFSVVISSPVPPGREHLKRKVTLAVQHIRKRIPPPVIPQPVESFSPRMPSSGFSTPSSATATFNYALAHQKILAASSLPPALHPVAPDTDANDNPNSLPAPFFEGAPDELSTTSLNRVSFVGPSAIFLPPLEINYSSLASQGDRLPRVQLTQDFELPFIGLRTGFSTIGGLRILLTDDQISEDEDQHESKSFKPQVLKELEVVGEVWVSA